MKKSVLSLSLVLLCPALPSFATSSICDAAPGNIVTNCGFEAGTYTSTIGGNTNTSVPVGWTPSAGYDLEPGFNNVGGHANSGTYGQQIGNDDGQPVPTLSQTLTDVTGASYAGTLFVSYGASGTSDTNVFFDVTIDGADVVSLGNTAPGTFTEYTFSFTGTGSDVLSFGGNTSPSEWYVDDIDVSESAGPPAPPVGATPEPSSLILLATASGPLFYMRQRLARRSS